MFTRTGLEATGFAGFVTFAALRSGSLALVPESAGAYVVLREGSGPPRFLAKNPGGRFKGKDPTEGASVLKRKWVDGAQVIYIGKARVLKRRLREFANFGAGKPIGHWGGRYIWQLSDSADLLVAWVRATAPETEGRLEARLVADFKREFDRLPFASIAEPR